MDYTSLSLEDLKGEQWIDAYGFDGLYQVSNFGRIKSMGRYVNNGKSQRWIKERIRKQVLSNEGRLTCPFSIENKQYSINVSALIWQSFNYKSSYNTKKQCIMHKNKNKSDNRLCNLELTTISNSHTLNFRMGLLPHLENQHVLSVGSKWNEEHGIYVDGTLTEILCNKCFTHKAISDFEHTRICCKKCRSISLGTKEFGKLEYLKSLKDAGLKRCYKCTEVKSLSDFHKGSNKCKQCKKAS
jgi:hypothetical protein